MRNVLLSLIVILVACFVAISAVEAGDFKDAVADGGKKFMKSVREGDADDIAELYAEDGKVFPPNSEIVTGEDAIESFWKTTLETFGVKDAKLEVLETEQEGDYGYEVGRYWLLGAAGQTITQGKYVVVWKKEDGKWKLYRDIWNTSLPPAPPAR